jgi:malonyl CoA-acyl carrier protein transacylase
MFLFRRTALCSSLSRISWESECPPWIWQRREWLTSDVNARAMRTKEMVARDLVTNIAHGVRWHDATTVLKELGCNLFLEVPPGHTLSDLAEENLPGIKSVPVEASVLSRVLRLAHQEEASKLEASRNC